MEEAPWVPYGTRTELDLRLQRNRPRQGDLQPHLRARPDQLPVQVAVRAPASGGPWRQAGRRLRAQPGRAGLSRPLRPDRRLRPGGAAVGRRRRPHRAQRDPHPGEDQRRRRKARRRQPGRQADRPGLVRRRRQVLPRRRQPPRPRRDGATDVRRPHLALHRHRRGADHELPGHGLRAALRLLPRLDRHRDLAFDGRALGLPGAADRDRARPRPGDRRPAARADPPLRRLDLDPDPDHRRRLGPLHGAAAARRGADPAREGVRRGGGRPGRRLRCGSCSASCCPTSGSTIIVFFALSIANNMLLESALSFLGVGVQAPELLLGHDDRHRPAS